MSDRYFDWAIYNANIVTMDPNNESAEMLGIKGDRFTYVGSYKSKQLEKAISSWDAERKTIIPGFIDLHTHLWKEAHVISIDLGSFQTYEDVIRNLEKEVKGVKNYNIAVD